MKKLTQEQRQQIVQQFQIVAEFLAQAQVRVSETIASYESCLDDVPGNYIPALERGIIRNIDRALDMMPSTQAVLEACETQMVELLERPFIPGDQLVRYVEHEFKGRRIPITGMN